MAIKRGTTVIDLIVDDMLWHGHANGAQWPSAIIHQHQQYRKAKKWFIDLLLCGVRMACARGQSERSRSTGRKGLKNVN
jgi:hypothetical protein